MIKAKPNDANNNNNNNNNSISNDFFPVTLIPPQMIDSKADDENGEIYQDIYDDEDDRSFKTVTKLKTQDDKIETSTIPSKFSETESTNSQSTVVFIKADPHSKDLNGINNATIENKNEQDLKKIHVKGLLLFFKHKFFLNKFK
jgi:hypothetical protein